MIDLVSPEELYVRLKNNSVCLIDVREKDEYDKSHLEGSILIPLSTFEITSIPLQEKPYVVYCRSGFRSAHVCLLLKQSGKFQKVYNLQGGLVNWQAQGFANH